METEKIIEKLDVLIALMSTHVHAHYLDQNISDLNSDQNNTDQNIQNNNLNNNLNEPSLFLDKDLVMSIPDFLEYIWKNENQKYRVLHNVRPYADFVKNETEPGLFEFEFCKNGRRYYFDKNENCEFEIPENAEPRPNEDAVSYWDGPLPNVMRIVTKHLMRWIKYNKNLIEELKANNYLASNMEFTPKQLEIIYKYLGEP